MSVNHLAQAVRAQLGIGRVLPLGGPRDGAWITERAATEVLRWTVRTPAGVRLGALRLTTADSAAAVDPPAVPAPPSALPPGPLRITADFTAVADRPLPAIAERLRAALLEAADRELGLLVSAADLRVSGLLEDGEGAREDGRDAAPDRTPGRDGGTEPPGPIAAAALGVPGVAQLAPVLGGGSRAVRLADGHALLQLAFTAGHRALDVALAVRAAARSVEPPPLTVAVLVTAVERG
ncbi:hypothetical protein ACIQNI_34090 [Streptomyces sp. NPDC091266]|uniref:hypothetical protein n=1 Tax=Streptomyces sp. NPDC091266 TaxID=3365978 RepID=UPI003826586C